MSHYIVFEGTCYTGKTQIIQYISRGYGDQTLFLPENLHWNISELDTIRTAGALKTDQYFLDMDIQKNCYVAEKSQYIQTIIAERDFLGTLSVTEALNGQNQNKTAVLYYFLDLISQIDLYPPSAYFFFQCSREVLEKRETLSGDSRPASWRGITFLLKQHDFLSRFFCSLQSIPVFNIEAGGQTDAVAEIVKKEIDRLINSKPTENKKQAYKAELIDFIKKELINEEQIRNYNKL